MAKTVTMVSLSFKDNFWNSEIGNFSGFDTLVKKIKEAQKLTKDFLEFTKQRANAQEVYGKTLAKIGKVPFCKNETGVMGQCWQNALYGSEGLSEIVLKTAASMEGVVLHNQEIMNKLREQRKREEDEVKQVQLALKTAITRAQTRHKQYTAKMKEKEQLEQAHDSKKDCQKTAQRLQQVLVQFDQACTNLTQAEQQLEEARCAWLQRTRQCYEVFEALEEQRLNALINTQDSLTQIEGDRINQEQNLLKQYLNITAENAKEDIMKFINTNKTEQEPPQPIKYTIGDSFSADFPGDEAGAEYAYIGMVEKPTSGKAADYTKQSPATKPKSPKTTESKRSSGGGTLPRKIFSILPSLKRDKDIMVSGKVIECKKETSVVATEPESASNPFDDELDEVEVNAEYSFIQSHDKPDDEADTVMIGSYKNAMMRVVFDYEAKHDTDISLREGELVTVVRYVDNEWAEVQCGTRNGFFPRNYIEPAST